MEKEFWLSMKDNVDVYVKKWYKENEQPVAIIQLAHGMAEHINRYDDFATYLVSKNIFVYGNDHRGHGQTGQKQGLLGYLSDDDGFTKTTNDLVEITDVIKRDYPNTPLFLFGHSMGSFLAREYIQKNSSEIDGVILSGTGYHTTASSFVARTIAGFLPAKEKSHFMNSLAFRTYNHKISENKTKFDWLTRDEKAVEKYIADPLSGYVPTARFFYDLMDGLARIHTKNRNKLIRKDFPILLISGDADPVGHYSKGVWKVANHYKTVGLTSITTMLFEDARHELLNELNKEEVYQTIYDWVNVYI